MTTISLYTLKLVAITLIARLDQQPTWKAYWTSEYGAGLDSLGKLSVEEMYGFLMERPFLH